MKRLIILLLFFVTCSVASYGQITFSSLTQVSDGSVDTSAQIVLVNSTNNLPVWRGSVGELLKAISRVGEVIATGSIVDGTITDADIASGADIGIGKLDTTSVDGVVSKSRLENALDDINVESSFVSYAADGTDTIDFASSALGVRRLSTTGIDSVGLYFANPVSGGQYTLHFQNSSSVNIGFPSSALFPNGSQIGVRTLVDTVYTNLYYDGTNFVFNSTFGTAYSGGGGAGGMSAIPEGATTDPNLFWDLQYSSALTVPTYDATPNVTHPDVIYYPFGFGGYKYWMAYTPYPAEARENPSVVASNDGETWITPGSNPVAGPLPSGYPSDPTWIRNGDSLILFYNAQLSDDIEKFYYKASNDGVNWSDSVLFFQEVDATHELASPTFAQYNGYYHMWYTYKNRSDTVPESMKMLHRQASSFHGLASASVDTCTFSNPYGDRWIWHFQIDYSQSQDQFVGITSFTLAQSGAPNNGGRFHYIVSKDAVNWTVSTLQVFNESPSMNLNKYVTSIVETGGADTLGFTFDAFTSDLSSWRIYRGKLGIKDTLPPLLADNWDAYKGEISSVYSFKNRFSAWHGLPVCELYTANKPLTGFLYHADSLLIDAVDSLKYTTWANGDEIFLKKMYDQATRNNFLSFSDSVPLVDTISTYYNVNALGFHLNRGDYSGNQYAIARTHDSIQTFITVTPSMKKGSGYLMSSGSYYLIRNRILAGGDGSFFFDRAPEWVNVISAKFGTSGEVRANTEVLRSSTLGPPPVSENIYIGALDNGDNPNNFANAVYGDIIMLERNHTSATLDSIEGALLQEYNLNDLVDTLFFATFTGTNGDSLLNYTPEINITGKTVSELFGGASSWGIDANTLRPFAGGDYLNIRNDTTSVCISYDIELDGSLQRSALRINQDGTTGYWNWYWDGGGATSFTSTGITPSGLNGQISLGSRTNPMNLKVCRLKSTGMQFYVNNILKYEGYPDENSGAVDSYRIQLYNWVDERPKIDNLLITSSANW